MLCTKCGQEYEGSQCPRCDGPVILVNNSDYLARRKAYEEKQALKERSASSDKKEESQSDYGQALTKRVQAIKNQSRNKTESKKQSQNRSKADSRKQGHGGIDGGVVGRETGIKESDLNLSVTLKLKTILQQAGFDVVLTRKTEAGLYGTATKGFKKRDMQRRKEIIEESKPIAMISIHQNYFPIRASRGGRVFYRKGSESGRQLAENIQRAFNDLYLEENVKERSAATGDYYMLKCTEYTSVIAECGFLSKKADEALLVTEEFQEKLAQSIYEGLTAYLAAVSGA